MTDLKTFMSTNRGEFIVIKLKLNNDSFNNLYTSAETNNLIVNSIITNFIEYVGPEYFVEPKNGLRYADVAGKIFLFYSAESGMVAPTKASLKISAPKAAVVTDNIIWSGAYQGKPEHRTPQEVFDFLSNYYSNGLGDHGKDFVNPDAMFVMQAITMWSSILHLPNLLRNGTAINKFLTKTLPLPPPNKIRHNIIMMDSFDPEETVSYIDKIIDENRISYL